MGSSTGDTGDLDEGDKVLLEEATGSIKAIDGEIPMPTLDGRCKSAPSLLKSLTASLAHERKTRIESEQSLKSDLERERHARAEAERECERTWHIVKALSPFERISLAFVARFMAAIRCPRPRCFCCGGPCFWFFFVPLLVFRFLRVLPLEVLPFENGYDEDGLGDLSNGSSTSNATSMRFQRWRYKPARRPALRFVERAKRGLRDCVEHRQAAVYESLVVLSDKVWGGPDAVGRKDRAIQDEEDESDAAVHVPPTRIEDPTRLQSENKPGLSMNHPVVMLPGMTSTALEVWRGVDCYEDATRQRVWSSRSSTQTFLLDPECLQRHLALNLTSWNDPDEIRVRASSGLSAADSFGPLNLWGELIVNLALLGYDETSLALMGYDWRLDPKRLEQRDAYFTRLRRVVETLVETNCGRRVVMVAHSLGANHALYFFNWVEVREAGWVEQHVASLTTIGGAFLGAPKCYPYLLSGEMTDTFQMGQTFTWLSEFHGGLNRDALLHLTRSWGSVAGLLPKGGDAIWRFAATDSINTSAPVEIMHNAPPELSEAIENMVNSAPSGLIEIVDDETKTVVTASYGADATVEFLRKLAPDYMELVDREYTFSPRDVDPDLGVLDPRTWSNPLLAPLPAAPSTKLHCLYGVGKATPRTIRFAPLTPNADARRTERRFEISRKGGVIDGDGDGTVPLVSLGYMCVEGWASAKLNPARLKVVTKEYVHEDLPAREAMSRPLELIQGLANEKDGDHVTILGNRELIADVIDIVLGGDTTFTESRISSDICQLAERVPVVADAIRDGAVKACDKYRVSKGDDAQHSASACPESMASSRSPDDHEQVLPEG